MYLERFGTSSCSLTEEDLVELIEVPRLEQVDFFPAPERNKVSARDRALQVALNAERSAQQYYVDLVEKTEPGPLRLLYRELAEMEDVHVAVPRTENVGASSEESERKVVSAPATDN